MAVEIMCMLFVAYIFIMAEWTIPFVVHSRTLHNFLENTFPKAIGILILVYVIGKYVLKIK